MDQRMGWYQRRLGQRSSGEKNIATRSDDIGGATEAEPGRGTGIEIAAEAEREEEIIRRMQERASGI